MSNHIKIDEDYVKSLIANAAWDQNMKLAEEVIVEEHVCPLCESKLDEELSDERVLEHLERVRDLLEVNTRGPDVEPNPGMDRAKELAKKGQATVAKKGDDEPDDTDEKEKVNAAKKAKIKEDDEEEEEEEEEAPDAKAMNAAKKAKIKEGDEEDEDVDEAGAKKGAKKGGKSKLADKVRSLKKK